VKHTLSVTVEDKPGALNRITTMFARRGFNIDSLAVGPTEREGVSCITLRVDCSRHTLEQIEKQIHKLVNVLRVTELVPGEAVERELLVVRVSAPGDRRAELVTTAQALGARLLDVGRESVVLELAGSPEELDGFHQLCEPYGVVDLVRTGRVGVPRASAERRVPRRLAAIR
jgi:acetolactate synthase-1/3 small subunit